jgi:HEAT repeat protein
MMDKKNRSENQQEQLPFSAALRAILTDEQIPVHLLYRLSDLTQQEFNQFTSGLATLEEDRRQALVRHLADIAEENFLVDFSPIFAYLLDDMDAAVRLAALDGVWDSTDSRLIEPIIALMREDPDMDVRAAAARALAHYVLMSEWGEISDSYSELIVDSLLHEHERADRNSDLKRATLEAMAAGNHPRIAACISEAYESSSADLQLSALFAMGNSADERWLPIVLDEMGSPSAEMRSEAARASGAIGSSDAISRLSDLLVDEDLDVCVSAVVALGQIGGEEAYELLNQLAEDPDYEELHDVIDHVLEEMDWTGGEFDLLRLSEQDFDEEDDLFAANDDDLTRYNGFRRTPPSA